MITVPVINSGNYDLPKVATSKSSGMDLRANIIEPIILGPLERKVFPTGLRFTLPQGFEGQIRPRSGLAAKHGVTVLNAPGTIDADYRGDVGVILVNLSNEPYTVQPGARIAQLIIAKYETVLWKSVSVLPDSERGQDGFGSTGTE